MNLRASDRARLIPALGIRGVVQLHGFASDVEIPQCVSVTSDVLLILEEIASNAAPVASSTDKAKLQEWLRSNQLLSLLNLAGITDEETILQFGFLGDLLFFLLNQRLEYADEAASTSQAVASDLLCHLVPVWDTAVTVVKQAGEADVQSGPAEVSRKDAERLAYMEVLTGDWLPNSIRENVAHLVSLQAQAEAFHGRGGQAGDLHLLSREVSKVNDSSCNTLIMSSQYFSKEEKATLKAEQKTHSKEIRLSSGDGPRLVECAKDLAYFGFRIFLKIQEKHVAQLAEPILQA